MIQDNPSVSYDEMAAHLQKDRTTIMRNMRKLREMEIVLRTGSRKTGRWEINRTTNKD
jgi:ATP-dependent DNA helicase RecG